MTSRDRPGASRRNRHRTRLTPFRLLPALAAAPLLSLTACDAGPADPGPGGGVATVADLGLRMPIAGVPNRDIFVGAYFDQLPSSGQRLDWACLEKTYDGHRGLDILLPHFPAMHAGVAVLASAAGDVVEVHDGEPDRNTVRGREPVAYGNHVIVDHGPVVAVYAHLRRASPRVAVGDRVRTGDTLGLVGSSGDSNWPHLHFEVQKFVTVPVSSNAGPCSQTRPTLWEDQLAYQDSFLVVDAGTTDRAALAWGDVLERPATVDTFGPEDEALGAWLILYNPPSASIRFELVDPDGEAVERVDGTLGASFSTTILQVRFPLAGRSSGPWRIRFRHAGRLVWQAPFRLEVPRGAAARTQRRAARAGDEMPPPPELLAWSGPAEGAEPVPLRLSPAP